MTQASKSPPSHPATPSTRVGTATVLRTLGVERLSAVPGWDDGDDTPLGRVNSEIRTAVRRLDHVQERLVALARTIRDDMQLVLDGNDGALLQANGLLASTAQSLDTLATRRVELYERLEALTGLHQVLATTAAPPPQAPAEKPIKLNDAQRRALDAVARGQVTVSEHSIRQGRQVTADGIQLHPATVNSLMERRLADRDRSTSVFVGQKLRLTPLGARVHAALAGTAATSRAAAPLEQNRPATVSAQPAPSTERIR
ncbi:hypothetical protein KV557_00310 [Kitasatospora aureofaciens]|uniref:hypothetical protein n=1 Tax=Kitasatospora aureofaciens TaxID=1894 RepID=UPI001C43BAF8|nr:hypothetical protein [Kitasatospora aureofaciens]MBV6695569.1 hypothetical protein [Kitasatospora aureofaciens]